MALIGQVKRTQLDDHGTSRAMNEVREVVNDLSVIGILNGRLLKDVVLTGGVIRQLKHGLGRELQGWLVVRQRDCTSTGYLNDVQVSNPHPETELWLKAVGQSPTLSLWVF